MEELEPPSVPGPAPADLDALGAAGLEPDPGPAGGGAYPSADPKAERRHVPWWAGVLALIVGGIASQLVGAIPVVVGAVLWLVEHGGEGPPDTDRMMLELTHSFWVLGPSIVLTGATMAGVAFGTAMLARVPVKRALGLRGAPWPAFIAAPIGILALGPTSDGLRRLMVRYLPNLTFGALEGLDEIARSAPIFLVLPAMALVPGFAEEVLFRGVFQRSIRNGVLAVLLSGTLFACYHMDPHHVVAVLPLGFYLAWLGQRTKSLAVPVTGHVFNNAAAVIGSVYFSAELSEDTSFEWWWIPIGWAICALCVAGVWWSTRHIQEE